MKRILFVFGFLAALPLIELSSVSTNAHMQSMSVGVRIGHAGFFYDHLRPYGEWIEIEPGFYAWRPIRIRHGWRPYLDGRWVWTDYGWYWHSYEPFGWAVFHYGRWYFDDYYGWIWVPDTVWGPAWVEWRYNDDYVGWAPLPPYASFSISIGIRFTTRWHAPAHYWSFVRYRNFASTRIDGYVVDEGYSRRLIRTTRGAVRYEVDRDRVINRGIDRALIERRGNVRIARTEVGETRERDERIVREGGRERIEVYRPSRTEFERRDEQIEARRPDRRISLDLERIERNRSTETRDRPATNSQSPIQGDSRDRSAPDRRTYDQDRPDGRAPNIRRERSEPQRKESSSPERRDSRNEFRSVQPEQPSSRPERKEGSRARSEPRKDEGQSRSGSKRGRDR